MRRSVLRRRRNRRRNRRTAATRTRRDYSRRRGIQTVVLRGYLRRGTLIARAFAPEPRREFLGPRRHRRGCRRGRDPPPPPPSRGPPRGARERHPLLARVSRTPRAGPRPRVRVRLRAFPTRRAGGFDFNRLSDGGAEFDAFDGAALERQRDASRVCAEIFLRGALAEGCSTLRRHASPSPSRTRVASLWALPKAVPVAVAVAVKVAVAVAARDGGGAMRSAKPASVGRTRSGCWKGPITTESGARGTGAEGSVTAARATSSTALARRIAGVGATILRKGERGGRGRGQRAPGRGRTGVPPGGGSRGTGRETGSGEGETNPAVRRSRSIARTVRTSRAPRRRENASARARRCARSTRPARSPVFAPEICGASAQRVDADANRDALEQRGVCPRNLERIREGATPEVNKRTPSGVEGGRPSFWATRATLDRARRRR